MEKYYDMSKGVKNADIVDDFLTEEAVENANAMKEQGFDCVGIYDATEFVNGKKDEVFAQLAADME